MDFWKWAVDQGLIAGDPAYYSTGKASAAEYAHAFDVAQQAAQTKGLTAQLWANLQKAGAIQGDPTYYSTGKAQPAEFANAINVATNFYTTGGGAGAPTGTTGTGTDTNPATLPGALKGGQTIRVRSADGIDRYYQVYEFPAGSGKYASFQYSGLPQVKATLGAAPTITAWTEANYNARTLAESQAEEIIGLAGSWVGFTNQIIQDAAAAAGVRDPSLVGRIASNPEMQQIMVQATVGDWTEAQTLAAQRATSFWKNTLYPGIEAFYGKTSAPEQAWANYNDSVSPALNALGYARDADGTYNTSIKKMLDAKIDADTFNENVPIFQQAVQNADYFNVLNARSQAELGKSITFGDWFGLLKGEGAPEIAKVAEGAMLAYQAQQASAGLDENMLQRLIAERDISENEARNLFSEVNQAVLALGEQGLKRGDLTRDDIISAAANIAPTSGLSPDEVRLKIAKLARENDLFDNEKMNFYVGYNAAGRPVRPGLAPLAPEGA